MVKKLTNPLFLVYLLMMAGCDSEQKYADATRPISISPTSTIVTANVSSPTPRPTFESPVISTSPNGKWVVIRIAGWDEQSIMSQDGVIKWELKGEPEKYGWYEWNYVFYRWSKNKNFVYLTLNPYIDGFAPFYQGTGLYRFDLTSGNIDEILSGEKPKLSAFSLSPDEEFLAYISYSDHGIELVIKDRTTAAEKQIPLDGYDDAGDILWSPQQDKVVLSVSNGDDWSNIQIALVLVNLRDLSKVKIYVDQQQVLTPTEWISDGEILVRSGEIFYYFNVYNKDLEIAPTATPFHS